MSRAQACFLGQIDGRCRWGVSLYPGDPVVARGGGRVRLADTDHLTVCGSQREVWTAVTGSQLLIAGLSEFLCSRLRVGSIDSDEPAPHITRQVL